MGTHIKVGIFVALGIVLAGITVFLIGENKKLWDPQVRFDAAFMDVAGLKPGSPVRMGGLDIGTVGDVSHSDDMADPRIYVRLSVVRSEARRVRADSIARVINKGLLGDKMIEVTTGSESAPPLAAGARVKTEEPLDLNKYIAKIDVIAEKVEKAVTNIELGTRPLSDPEFSDNLKGSVASLHVILDGVAHKDGAVHKLIFDPQEAEKVARTLTELQGAAGEVHAAMADVRQVTDRIKAGPGIAHAVVYDGELSKSAAGAVSELEKDLRAVREGNGIAHSLIYGDDQTQQVMGNVNAMSGDLRHIVADVRAGKGTVGGLLVDPSIYEDVKSLVGNMERNQVLRALVRYSIKADEGKPRAAPQAAPPAVEPEAKR